MTDKYVLKFNYKVIFYTALAVLRTQCTKKKIGVYGGVPQSKIMALELELKTYESLLDGLLNEQGKFALIHDRELDGVYETYDDALKIGYDKFGVDTPFLVKKILASENVQYFTRDIDVSCPA